VIATVRRSQTNCLSGTLEIKGCCHWIPVGPERVMGRAQMLTREDINARVEVHDISQVLKKTVLEERRTDRNSDDAA
jgi:hypothetical protein